MLKAPWPVFCAATFLMTVPGFPAARWFCLDGHRRRRRCAANPPATLQRQTPFRQREHNGRPTARRSLRRNGQPCPPFTLANCQPLSVDSTLEQVGWKGKGDLSVLAGEAVRFRFELANGSLYAFWVSRDKSGRSDGYVAAGGPGYTGLVDTVGRSSQVIAERQEVERLLGR